jgi:hypothetical protein
MDELLCQVMMAVESIHHFTKGAHLNQPDSFSPTVRTHHDPN